MGSSFHNQSVIKAFALLNAFRTPQEWLTNSELARRAGVPEASSYRLLQTLVRVGAVVRSPRARYRPGMMLVSLSHNVLVGELLRDAGRELVSELSRRLEATIHLGMLEDGMVTYLAKATTPGSVSLHTRVGAQLEAYCSALGKVLLADLPPAELEEVLLTGDLVALTPHTLTDPAELRQKLLEVRRLGFARDGGEAHVDIRCVAAPVRDRQGRVVAALSAAEVADRMSGERENELRDALLAAAAALGDKVFPQPSRANAGMPRQEPPSVHATGPLVTER